MLPVDPMVPQNIDPGEAILAVVGIRPLLTKEVERITAPMWREIGRIEQTIEKRSRELIRGSLGAAEKYPEVDYDQALKAFTEPPAPDQIMAMLADVPTPYALPFLTCAARAYNTLRGYYPIAQERTVFGVNTLEPGDFALGQFEDLLEAADRPLSLFQMADTGRLTTKQAAMLQAIYPTLYQETLVALAGAVMDAKADGVEPECARGVSVLFGVPGIDPNLRQQLVAAPAPQPPPEQKRIEANSKRAQLIATKSDRLELAGDQ